MSAVTASRPALPSGSVLVLCTPAHIDTIASLGCHLSPAMVADRFWLGSPAIPASYLDLVRTGYPTQWNAVVAERDRTLVGWADFARNANGTADIAVCLVDAEQGRGTGRRLLAAALDHCHDLGIDLVQADVELANRAARRAWRATVPPGCIVGCRRDETSIGYTVDLSRWPRGASSELPGMTVG